MSSKRDHKDKKHPSSSGPSFGHKRRYGGEDERSHSRHESDDRNKKRRRDQRPQSFKDRRKQTTEENFEWGKATVKKEEPDAEKVEKEKPNFEISGKLAEDTNTFKGVVIKYSEPDEARKPKRRWRLYRFKGEEEFPYIQLHRQSAFLLGRSRHIADIPIDHPSCSKQHAVLQFRLVPFHREDGTKGRRVRPYIIDLGSANGTFVNNKPIEAQRYVELIEKDVLKFGFSSREYVLLHEESKEDDDDDEDVEQTTQIE